MSRERGSHLDIFAVFLDEDKPESRLLLKEHYPGYFELSKNLFLVPSEEIAERVAINSGIKGDSRIVTGVVFKLNKSYSGYTTRALWDWLKKVEEQD